MNLFKVVYYDVRDFFTSWLTYVFLFFTIAPPVGMLIASHYREDVVTTGYNLILAFGSFGAIFVIMSTIRVFTKDISENTNMLFMNSKKNRTVYAIAKIVSMALIGVIYGLILVLIMVLAKQFMDVDLLEPSMMTSAHHESISHMLSEVILSYGMIALVFGTIYFFLSLFFRSSVFVFVIAIITIIFYDVVEVLGSMAFGKLFDKDPEKFTDFLQKYLPFSTSTSGLSGLSITNPQFLMLGVYFIVFFILILLRIRKRDY